MDKYEIKNVRTGSTVLRTYNKQEAVKKMRENETDYTAIIYHNGEKHEVYGAMSLKCVSFLN